MIDRYLKQNEEMENDIAKIEAAINENENELSELRRTFKSTRKELERRKELDNRIGRFNERQKAVERARTNAERLESERFSLNSKLIDNNFAQVERESLINLKVELARLEFDPVLFTSLQSQIRLKRHVESRHQQLLRDLDELARIGEKLPALIAASEQWEGELNSEAYGGEIRARLKIF